jgi:hypothetical protein
MARDALELRGFLAEVLVERRQDLDTDGFDVLACKKYKNRVREVVSVEVEEGVQKADWEEIDAHRKSATFPGSSGGAASLV